MKVLKCTLSIVTLVFAGTSLAGVYGESFTVPKGGGQSVSEVITLMSKDKKTELNQIAVSGEISSVCQASGCWVSLKTGEASKVSKCSEGLQANGVQQELRVMFKDHSFKVPKDMKGQVMVYGSLKRKKLSPFQRKHFLKDAGCSVADTKKIKGDLFKYQMTATGVRRL